MKPKLQELKRRKLTHGSYRVYPHPDMHEPVKRVTEHFVPDRCV